MKKLSLRWKRVKNYLIKCICLVLVTVTTFSLCGCFGVVPKEFEVGDFKVTFRNKEEEKDPNSYIWLLGLSEAGQKKKAIVLPKKINGHPYALRFKQRAFVPGYGSAFFMGEMEKFYFEYPGQYTQEDKKLELKISSQCPNLKKVILNADAFIQIRIGGIIKYYYNYKRYRLKMEEAEFEFDKFKKEIQPANLQYMYNFEGAENDGYFWIDSVDNGEKVEIIPDTPEREGYTFGGWYTEEKCENKFDFETVFNKPVLEVGDVYPDDYVTYLYAKWIQNEG